MSKGIETGAIVDQLSAIYEESVAKLRAALSTYIRERTPPDPKARAKGCFAYPELRIEYRGEPPRSAPARAFARLAQSGTYATSIARPDLYRDYLEDQIEHLARDYDVTISVGRSTSEIPYPYVIENSGIEVGDVGTAELSRFFPSNELVHIGDEIADGVWNTGPEGTRPLALFDGPRTDFSLARLKHYTGTPAEHFQHFVLFTNYVRYVDEFVGVAIDALRRTDGRFISLSVPGGVYARGERGGPNRRRSVAPPSDAGLPFDGGGRDRHYPRQHRRRAVQREDDLRPCGCPPAARVADDRPLRRPQAEPEDRRLRARPRLFAR
jgi:AMP nucleosidase